MPRFAFRVNGNKDIGMGHVIRCLCLAKCLEERPLFLVNDHPKVIEKVEAYGGLSRPITALKSEDFQVMVDALNHYPSRLKKRIPSEEQELKEVIGFLRKERVEALITDLVSVSKEYLEALKESGLHLTSLDELGITHFSSDLVFNCNSVLQTKKYQKEIHTQVYMGSEYTLLRDEFAGLEKRVIQNRVERILVTCGGTDMKGLSITILRALRSFSVEFEITLVVGPDFKFRRELNTLLREMKNIIVKEDVSEMCSEMLRADLAIASGGTTMYELAACGTPSIILGQYAHQVEFARELERQGVLLHLGLGEIVEEEAIRKAVYSLLDVDKRRALSRAGQSVIDGKGAWRVAGIIRESLN